MTRKISKFFRKIEVRILYLIFSFKRINKPHIGDLVIFNGFECHLVQGASDPYWSLVSLSKEGTRFDMIHRNKFRLSYKPKDLFYRLKYDYDFLMSYWYKIDINRSGGISYSGM
jgi:hypothetical protein